MARRSEPADGRGAEPLARGRSRLRLTLLGGFVLQVDGAPAELPHSAQRLVAFLALKDRPLQRPHVAGNLWLESSEPHAGACLRSALRRARQVSGIVHATRDSLALADAVDVDVDRLRTVALGMRHIQTLPERAAIRELQASGDLLPDWYEDWLVLERERLRQLRLHALELLCQRLGDAGRFTEAVEAGLAAVDAEPLRESAHRAVIRSHLAEGNHAEAVRQYEACARLLRTRVGVEPSPSLRALVALRACEPRVSGRTAVTEPSRSRHGGRRA